MKYRGRECTESRAFSDATGTGTEWRFPTWSDTGTTWPVGEQWCSRQHATRIPSAEEVAELAKQADAARIAAEETKADKLEIIRNGVSRSERVCMEEHPEIVQGTVTPTRKVKLSVGGIMCWVAVEPVEEE